LAILTAIVSSFGLANGYFNLIHAGAIIAKEKAALSFVGKTGYLGMFFILNFSTIPVYVLVPFYGYLCSLGIFNIYKTLLVLTLSALVLDEVEYFSGRYVARSLLMKALSRVGVSESRLEAADDWIEKHGVFAVFLSTYFLELGDLSCLAAGTLDMNPVLFTAANLAGEGSQFALLLYLGYTGSNVLNSSFDYANRWWMLIALTISAIYIATYVTIHLAGARK